MQLKPKKQGYDVYNFLLNLASDLSTLETPSELINVIPRKIHEITGLSRSAVLLSQESPQILKFESVARYPESLIGTTITLDQLNLSKDSLASGDTLFVNTDDLKINEILRMYLKNLEVKKLMITPLSGALEMVGILIADEPGLEDTNFSEDEISLVNAIAHQIASAIENLTLLKKKRLGSNLSNTLNIINKAIASSLNFEEIMEKVITLASKAIKADSALIVMPDKDGWRANYVYGDKMQELSGHLFTQEQVVRSMIADKINQPVLIKIPEKDARSDKWLTQKYGIKSSVNIALKVGKRFIGNADFHYYAEKKKFDIEKIDFLNKVSVSLTLALQNANLFKQQQSIANTLQEAMVSTPGIIKNLEISHLYQSATETAKVGGDFYDVFEIDDNSVGILIGDVSGKGIQAASIASLVSNSIASFVTLDKSPSNILDRVNFLLRKKLENDSFITIFLCVYDAEKKLLSYCNAGHPPAMLKDKNGKIKFLEHTSQILGPFDSKFIEQKQQMSKGDTLLLYTDGVIESKKDSELFGTSRVKEVFDENNDVKSLANQVYNKVSEFSSGHLSDDVAILALKVIQ